MVTALVRLLKDPQRQMEMSEQNFSVAMQVTMPQIIRKYLRHFAWQLSGRTPQRLGWGRRVRFTPGAFAFTGVQLSTTGEGTAADLLSFPQAAEDSGIQMSEPLPEQAAPAEAQSNGQKPAKRRRKSD
jgi:hypothetical protein